MSDTPRTDAEQWTIPDFPAEIADVVYAAFARRLERELTAAHESHKAALKEVVAICDTWDDGGSCNVSNVRSEIEAMLALLEER